MANAVDTALTRIRTLCLSHPGAEERPSHGFPTFIVGKKVFAYFSNNHHNDGRMAVLVKVGMDGQDLLVRGNPERFYVPPYLGHLGWVGVRLEGRAPWGQVEDLIARSWKSVAPRKLLKAALPADG